MSDVKVHGCPSIRMFCLREPCPEGPCYMYWFALNDVNARVLLRKLIVKAVVPLRSIPLGLELAAGSTLQREAKDI